MRHKLIGYIFKMAAQHSKLASDSLEKNPDNIAVSFLPDFESLFKKALEKGLNYFIQGYIHNIKISETHACGSKIMQDVGGQWEKVKIHTTFMSKSTMTNFQNRTVPVKLGI